MGKLRIFLADDHAVVRAGLKTLVDAQSDMVVVGEAGDGQMALEQARECAADVVIMDISMPNWSLINSRYAQARLGRSSYRRNPNVDCFQPGSV